MNKQDRYFWGAVIIGANGKQRVFFSAVMRVKEYERERRLKLRDLSLQGLDGNGKPLR